MPGVSMSWRAVRVPTAPTPTTSAVVIASPRGRVSSTEFGTFELAPAATRRRDSALAAQPCEHAHQAHQSEHDKQALEDLHARECIQQHVTSRRVPGPPTGPRRYRRCYAASPVRGL